jgi:hypothetical protein
MRIPMIDYEIAEVRRIRQQISAQHGHDVKKLANDYRQHEQELRKCGKYRFADEQHVSTEQENARETAS